MNCFASRPVLSGAVFLIAVAVAGCSASSSSSSSSSPASPRAVELLTLAPGPVRDTSEYLGSLLSRDSVTVLPQVSGYVRRVLVKPGQQVKAGAVLIEIDSREEEAARTAAVAQQASSETRLSLARQTVERTEALVKEGLAPTQELERAQAEVQAAVAAVRAAEAAVEQRSVALQFHAVRAAVGGTIGEVWARVGDAVTPATALTTIANTNTLELSLGLPAHRVSQLPPDADVEILDDQGEVRARSTIFYVAPQADAKTQLVVVKCAITNDGTLRPGQVVRARVVFGERQALQVPVLAVIRQSGQAFLYEATSKDGKTTVVRAPVTLGAFNGQDVVIERGLEARDVVAVSSIQSLRDGAVVVAATPSGSAPTAPTAH